MPKILLFDNANFTGDKLFCEQDHSRLDWPTDRKVGSLVVIEGTWNLYHNEEYGAPAYTVDASGGAHGNGAYAKSDEWGVGGDRVNSIRHVGGSGKATSNK